VVIRKVILTLGKVYLDYKLLRLWLKPLVPEDQFYACG
jgi:hypothetical protein